MEEADRGRFVRSSGIGGSVAQERSYKLLEQLDENDHVRVFRAIDESNGARVVLKQLRRAPPRVTDLERMETEFTLLRALDVPGVVRAIAAFEYRGRATLVLEDCGGTSLDRQLGDVRLGLATKIDLAIRLTSIVAAVHHEGVVHRDLKPSNVVWNRADDRLELIDFSLATRAARNLAAPAAIDAFGGTMHYVSPEQTGRVGRLVDRRSDLYSLGVTFYRMLTGRVPFEGSDVAALVHAHVARAPTPPRALVPELPASLSAIVDKLLQKDPDDRYQTADGVVADLRRVAKGEDDFELGEHDARGVIRVRETLVGRDTEIERLEVAVSRLAAGESTITVVTGEAGVGKSALVLELARIAVRHGGVFARGKFDLAIASSPYHPIAQLLDETTALLLASPEPVLEALRDRLEASMGTLVSAFVDVFPRTSLLFRTVPPVEPAPPTEARNRLVAAFVAFTTTIATANRFLLLFVDDVQWADDASLTLIEALVRDDASVPLGLVVAARDTEIAPGSRTAKFFAELGRAPRRIDRFALTPLVREPVALLLADSLRTPLERVERLAGILCEKTHGNPFFLRLLLNSAVDRGLVRYEGRFVWDDAAIEMAPVTENVASLLTSRLAELPEATRVCVEYAARLGEPIECAWIARLTATSDDVLLERLAPAIDLGIIFLAGSAIRFAHDKVVEALLPLASADRSEQMHRAVSNVLLEAGGTARFFEAVDQLALAGAPEDDSERERRASLALKAARRASDARAYEAAELYYERYDTLLTANAYDASFEETFAAHLEWAETAYLAGRYERAEPLFANLGERARTSVERLRVRRTLINFYEKTYRFIDAIKLSFATLSDVGVEFPPLDEITPAHVGAEVTRFLEVFAQSEKNVDSLPICEAPSTRDAIAMLINVGVPLWNVKPETMALPLGRAGILSLERGLAPASGASLVLLGSMLCLAFGNPVAGAATARLGLAAQEKHGDPYYDCLAHFAYFAMVQFHLESARLARPGLLDAYHRGVAAGNRQWASYCANHYCIRGALIGLPLRRVADDVAEYRPALLRLEQEDALGFFEPLTHFVERMLELPGTPWRIGVLAPDADAAVAVYESTGHYAALGLHIVLSLLERLVLGNDEEAYRIATQREAIAFAPTGQLQTEIGIALVGMAIARRAPPSDTDADALLERVVERLTALAQNDETSFTGYLELVLAECSVRRGELDGASFACDRAIDVFERDQVLPFLGLANELAGRIWNARSRARIGRGYLESSRRAFERWGAPGAVRRLDAELGLFATRRAPNVASESGSTTSSETSDSTHVDFTSLLKATRAITGEIVLDRLITTLLRIVVENAGANRGHLFLEREQRLELEAVCDAELVVVRSSANSVASATDIPIAIANVVARTKDPVLVSDAQAVPQLAADPYLRSRGRVSLLVAPIMRHDRVRGVVVLENDLVPGAFTARHLDVIAALNAQIAVALENARLYEQSMVRAEALSEANQRLRDEIVDRVRAEKALVESEARLRQAQKMEAIGLLAGGVAHDFNNQLTAILGFAQLLLEAHSGNAELCRDLLEISEAANRSASLTRQLLAFSRRHALKVEPTDVNTVVTNVDRLLQRVLGADVTCELHLHEQPAVILGDAQQLENALTNLAVNARDAMPKGGRLTITTDVVELTDDDARQHASMATGRYAVLSVADTGCGMDDAIKARIFEPFFTTKDEGRGTGLGLSMVYGIVKQMGGFIWVYSEIGRGTTFRLYFPTTSEARRPTMATVQAPVNGRHARILVIEDDTGVRGLITRALTRNGYAVFESSNGDEARRHLRGMAAPPDLVLTDIVLPGESGIDFLSTAPLSTAKVMFMSGYSVQHIDTRGLGDVHLLEKPFTVRDLLSAIGQVLAAR